MFRFLFTYLIILLALCALPYAAQADGDPTTDNVPRILPYQGILELDGQPVNATGDNALHLGFQLFNGPDAEQPVYRQDLRVEVYAGRFTATIGPVGVDGAGAEVPISQIIANADDLYLGMILLGDPADPADDIALNNRQRIHASPYAMWTTAATNLDVARDLRVGRDLAVAQDIATGRDLTVAQDVAVGRNLAVTGDMTVQGALNLPAGALDAHIRDWVRGHCKVQLGWRDQCFGCAREPAKFVTAGADGRCDANEAHGSHTGCRNGNWAGVNTDGNVSDDDVFYVRLICD